LCQKTLETHSLIIVVVVVVVVVVFYSGYGKFNYMLNLVAIPAVWSIAFDTATISYILPSAECDLNLSNLDKGILNAMVYGGKEIFMRCNKE